MKKNQNYILKHVSTYSKLVGIRELNKNRKITNPEEQLFENSVPFREHNFNLEYVGISPFIVR